MNRTTLTLCSIVGALCGAHAMGAPAAQAASAQASADLATRTTTTYTRIALTMIGNGLEQEVPIFTVPAGKPIFLRQSYTSVGVGVPGAYPVSCYITVNGVQALQLFSGPLMDMNVPFAPGETVALRCSTGSGGAYSWTFVFSS